MDIKKLTLGELAQVEKLGGHPISSLQDESVPKVKMMTALAFVIKKRENPDFTFTDAENLTMDELENLIGDLSGDESEGK